VAGLYKILAGGHTFELNLKITLSASNAPGGRLARFRATAAHTD
jgi:hypothetical protein